MKLFYGFNDVMENYYDNLTEEQIDELESQGVDVTELRAKFQERQEMIEKAGMTDLSLIAKYERIPRDTDTGFFKSMTRNMPFFGKQKYIEKYQNAKLVYSVVVQAAPVLYEPGDVTSAAIVLLFARDEKHAKDFEFLYTIADLFVAMRDGEVEVPESCKELVKELNDPTSNITENIKGESIDERFRGADICVKVAYTPQDRLPGKMIPNDDILPALYFEHSEDNFYLDIIDGKFYKGDE